MSSKLVIYMAAYRQFPKVEIFSFNESLEKVMADLKNHPRWQEGRYVQSGPVDNFKGSLESYWDTAFALEYPVFEILKLEGKGK